MRYGRSGFGPGRRQRYLGAACTVMESYDSGMGSEVSLFLCFFVSPPHLPHPTHLDRPVKHTVHADEKRDRSAKDRGALLWEDGNVDSRPL